jgi:hypothetical protein
MNLMSRAAHLLLEALQLPLCSLARPPLPFHLLYLAAGTMDEKFERV